MLFASVVLAGHGIQPSNFLPHAYVLNGFASLGLGRCIISTSLYLFVRKEKLIFAKKTLFGFCDPKTFKDCSSKPLVLSHSTTSPIQPW